MAGNGWIAVKIPSDTADPHVELWKVLVVTHPVSSRGNRSKTSPLVYSSSPSRPLIGVRVPNRPSASSLMPAEKNKVLAGPAVASFPNVRDHRPLMVNMELSAFLRNPSNLYVKPLNAAIWPLPKLPTRIALLNSPKSRVVHTTPHGELNQSPCWR